MNIRGAKGPCSSLKTHQPKYNRSHSGMASPNLEIRVQADTQEMTRVVAQEVVHFADQAIRAHGVFTLALAGGTTPRRLYTLLASHPFRDQVAWDKIKFFGGMSATCLQPIRIASPGWPVRPCFLTFPFFRTTFTACLAK